MSQFVTKIDHWIQEFQIRYEVNYTYAASLIQNIVFKTHSCDYASIYATSDALMFHTNCSDITDS